MHYIVDLIREGIFVKEATMGKTILIAFQFGNVIACFYTIPIEDIEIDEESGRRIILQKPLHTYAEVA